MITDKKLNDITNKLFKYLSIEHDLTLLDTELYEIFIICKDDMYEKMWNELRDLIIEQRKINPWAMDVSYKKISKIQNNYE